ncbi:manganese efflux pump MntP [Demequina zhanjiangensis]|uniref:Putative manganese efflux pump MntP n=1 Tax=Demequina zhanjiangensis TaxID=3051659 RepID=A0ABT8G455_9MICO|nr:manganese efflux pump MntP family protein [Demequina sp. SYSU T00b26]MDN4473903.1 manganese efflux pump MntP family protein [Demequina sp. SYSU T00b26]
MSILTLLLTALGVSADAFAVSVGKGLHLRRLVWKPALQLAFTFGLFQALMPVIGWLLASTFAAQMEAFDHWIAFGLLAAIGAKMLWEARTADADDADDVPDHEIRVPLKELVVLGIATSIDALAVGISFAFLDVDIVLAVVVIGVVTFVASLAGYRVGHHAGKHLRSWAEIAGGLVLIGIGVKILVDHLMAG